MTASTAAPLTAPRVLSLIPPMTQLNTPYPSTAYLTGFLRSRGVDARQDDLALRLVLELFSPAGLDALRDKLRAMPPTKRSATLTQFDAEFDRYRAAQGAGLKVVATPSLYSADEDQSAADLCLPDLAGFTLSDAP